ncbi:YciI family protein [Pseudoclavibacter chungangensis]|uniref:YciI family protein n=2 Tax=Pseudoclavibacter chungangensis TaxID=587635 RepID=A0A7J5C1N1_9MICO|nr:YciI family protein [Pseudoclavibacter chungangensis]
MLIMRATDEATEASKQVPFEEIINAMGAYNEALMAAGVMVDGGGLSDAAQGRVVAFGEGEPTVTEGPYAGTESLFSGYWMLDVPTIDEAVAWAAKAPLGPGSKLEIRRLTDETDFADFADNEFIEKEVGWREEQDARRAES